MYYCSKKAVIVCFKLYHVSTENANNMYIYEKNQMSEVSRF